VSIRVLLGSSLLLLTLSAVFGFLNTGKIKALRAESAEAIAARKMVENARVAQRKQPRGRETNSASSNANATDVQGRLANAEAEAAKAQAEKAAALAKLQATETQLAQFQKQGQQVGPGAPDSTGQGGPSVAELQAQLDEARHQLDNAEREKLLVAEKTQTGEPLPAKAPEEQVKRPRLAQPPGLHGTILAVNQAYNFVVLNLGGRQGVENNSEMLILRGGTLIGKIRVSSVEPATAIGDIISSSLPRGVQVQPGDTVVYVGTDS
jgi:hypothetical protein